MILNPLRLTLTALLFSCFSCPLAADSLTFSLLPPGGTVTGSPGSTVGWGYSITNNSTLDWFIATGLNPDSSFSDGTPLSLFDFPNIGPGASAVESFDSVNSIGLYQFSWDPSAPSGDSNSGNFALSGQWWDGDPLNGGNFIANAIDTTAMYTAIVDNSTSSPEPMSAFLALAGLVGIGCIRKYGKKKNK
jgi:hypothetical protein